MGSTDIGDAANPFTNATSSRLHADLDQTQLYRIKGSAFDPMNDFEVIDPEAAAREYTETQDMWLWGNNRWVETSGDIIGDLRLVAYTIKFEGATDDLGIPVCTTPLNTSLYAYCVSGASGANTDDATENHAVRIKFLGEDWIITDMNAPSSQLGTEQPLVAGGTVKLGKEAITDVVNQGEWLEVSGYKFVLADIVADTHEAAIDIIDANGATVSREEIAEGGTKEVTIGDSTVTIKVLTTVPGYTFGAKWAKFSVLSQEMELSSGQRLDPNKDANREWRVVLGWKNRGASAGGLEDDPDHLRTIILYTTDTQNLIDDVLEEGDYVPIVQDPTNWRLSYGGLDIDNDDRDTLKFQLERDSTKNNLEIVNGSSNFFCNVTAPYVKVTSSTESAFRLAGRSVTTDEGIGPTLYIATNGLSCDAHGTGFLRNSVMITSSTSVTGQDRFVLHNYSGSVNISYELAGDGETTFANGGVIVIQNNTDAANWSATASGLPLNETLDFNASQITDVRTYFAISEKAGIGTSNTVEDLIVFALRNASSGTSWTFNFDGAISGTNYLEKDKIRYFHAGPVSAARTAGTQKEGFITERGSVYVGTDDTAVEFKIATTLGHAQFVLATVEAAETEAGTVSKLLGEGDSYTTENGVIIEVAEINCDAVASGTVSTGTSPACVVDDSGLSAVIMPSNQASVTTGVPYGYSNFAPLVVLDSEAANVGTLVTVGGPVVNTVTQQTLAGSDVADPATWPNNRLVREIGPGKIVVAGWEAADTLAAAEEFIGQLQSQ